MADISSYLQKILEAVYGEEVRGSIHDALAAMNVESNSAMQMAATAKDSAQASALTATQKAAEALDSAGKAKDSETKAKESEDNASISETNAGNYAADALLSKNASKTSETNAANSEATALQKASDAKQSKEAAALSEANVLAAETRVKEVKTEVEAMGAQTASDKAAAEAAKKDAEAAKTAAQTAAGEAEAAKTAAEDAQNGAETAEGHAQAAKTDAENAKKAAETAKADSEAARDAAKGSATDAASSAETAQQYSGNSPKPQDGTWWIWNANTGAYEDTGISCELVGPTGNGIASFVLTSGDHSPGSTDTYTITFTDGSVQQILVYNGKNGTGIGDIIGIEFDLTLAVADWSDTEITVFDSQLLASRKYKYLIDAYDGESKVEVVECNVKAKDITVDGAITFTAEIKPINPITVNVVRLEMGANTEGV